MMSDSTRVIGRPRRAWPPKPRAAAVIIATSSLALPVAACGSSSSSTVGTYAQEMLAFSHCVRSHGVRNFPDPISGGTLSARARQIAASNPRFPAAQTACQPLLPIGAPLLGGQPTPAELTVMESDALKFARCMRSDGVTTWPDYTLRDGIPIFDLHHTSVDPNSPQIMAKQVSCTSLLHLSYSPPTSGGAA